MTKLQLLDQVYQALVNAKNDDAGFPGFPDVSFDCDLGSGEIIVSANNLELTISTADIEGEED